MNMEFMDEYYERMRADDIEKLSSQRNDEYEERAKEYNRYADYLRAGELPLEDLAYNYKAYGLPCFESIRRARQRVQSLFPELSRNSSNNQDGSVVIVININGG